MPRFYSKKFMDLVGSYSKGGAILGLPLSKLCLKIRRSFNNLFVSVSKRDDGKVLAFTSLGMTGVRGAKRNNALVAESAAVLLANQVVARGLSQKIDVEVSTPFLDAFSKNTIRSFVKALETKGSLCRIVNVIRYYRKAHAVAKRGFKQRRV